MIQRNVRLETSLIDDLLDVTRIARGKLEIARTSMDVHEAIRKAVEICRSDVACRKQRLAVSLEAEHHVVDGDFTRLEQVFWNLLQNASKFSPDNESISIKTWNEEGLLLAEVKDNGIGISPECLAIIFDTFTQADSSISKKYGGLGLGLAISKASVEAHGGRLRAASAGKGKGSVFTISLPLKS